MSKRVYELSRELGISNKDLLKLLKELDFNISSTIASISPEIEEQVVLTIKNKKNKKNKDSKEKDNLKPSDSKLSKKRKPQGKNTKSYSKSYNDSFRPHVNNQEKIKEKKDEKVDEPLYLEPMTVEEFARKAKKTATEVILSLLIKGKAVAKNQVISEDLVELLAKEYNIELKKPLEKKHIANKIEKVSEQKGNWVERFPIVVVVGHVDHGKTTLLDYIRKTRVTAKEKGGITQHLGAYEAETAFGNIVFLDTPGHEAFSIMRARGIKVADIAVLVVAADDGVMPQTAEAIKRAKEVGLPIIVAINKIDKATSEQIEKTKSELAQHDLLPEEWGGQTVLAPISAKTGQGVDSLLEVLALQAELMELKANLSVPASGYILESSIERGRGPVATVICLHGKLKLKDYFICENASGKVTSLIDSQGKSLKEVMPSVPVKVTGFSELPKVGDTLKVVGKAESKKGLSLQKIKSSGLNIQNQEKSINLIVKADNASSQEALIASIEKLSKKLEHKLNIVDASVGFVSESDVNLASDTGSFIYGFNIKVEPNAKSLAIKLNVDIRSFDIIYKLLEDLEELSESKKETVYISKKVAEATVLKVFNIKSLGVIAGAVVNSGTISKDCFAKIYRGKNFIGEGFIKSLQRERKSVKEVHTGFECAFLVENFTDWQVDDRVEFYLEVPKK